MTIYTCLRLIDTFGIDIESEIVIDQDVKKVEGTSAYLEPGDVLSVKDLMYGMMLPSGNDAAFQIARVFG